MHLLILDIGGTGSRAMVCSMDEEEQGTNQSKVVEGPGANPNRVGKDKTSETITNLVNNLRIPDGKVEKLVVGLAGYSHADSFAAVRNGILKSELKVESTKNWLMSDAELAHIAAFGYDFAEDCDGILLIAGTGSIALARPSSNGASIIRSGGHGYKDGDEGSGHWIGLQLKKLQATNLDVRASLLRRLNMNEEDLTTVEPSVLSVAIDDLSPSHDMVRQIARDAGAHLANLCIELKKKKDGLRRVKVWGSVLKNSCEVRHHFHDALHESDLSIDGEVVDVLQDSLSHLVALTDFPMDGAFLQASDKRVIEAK